MWWGTWLRCCLLTAEAQHRLTAAFPAADARQVWPNHISSPYAVARMRAAAAAHAGGGSVSTPAPCTDGGGRGWSLEEAIEEESEPPTPTLRAQLDREASEGLLQRFPQFFACYGYS